MAKKQAEAKPQPKPEEPQKVEHHPRFEEINHHLSLQLRGFYEALASDAFKSLDGGFRKHIKDIIQTLNEKYADQFNFFAEENLEKEFLEKLITLNTDASKIAADFFEIKEKSNSLIDEITQEEDYLLRPYYKEEKKIKIEDKEVSIQELIEENIKEVELADSKGKAHLSSKIDKFEKNLSAYFDKLDKQTSKFFETYYSNISVYFKNIIGDSDKLYENLNTQKDKFSQAEANSENALIQVQKDLQLKSGVEEKKEEDTSKKNPDLITAEKNKAEKEKDKEYFKERKDFLNNLRAKVSEYGSLIDETHDFTKNLQKGVKELTEISKDDENLTGLKSTISDQKKNYGPEKKNLSALTSHFKAFQNQISSEKDLEKSEVKLYLDDIVESLEGINETIKGIESKAEEAEKSLDLVISNHTYVHSIIEKFKDDFDNSSFSQTRDETKNAFEDLKTNLFGKIISDIKDIVPGIRPNDIDEVINEAIKKTKAAFEKAEDKYEKSAMELKKQEFRAKYLSSVKES